MQHIVYETRQDSVIETGAWMGGSMLYWAYTLNGVLDSDPAGNQDFGELWAYAPMVIRGSYPSSPIDGNAFRSVWNA